MSNFELCSPIATSDTALVVGAFHHIGVFGSSPLFQRDEAAGSETTAFLHFDEESQSWLLSIDGLENTVGMAAGGSASPPATGWRIPVEASIGFCSWGPMEVGVADVVHEDDVVFGEEAEEEEVEEEEDALAAAPAPRGSSSSRHAPAPPAPPGFNRQPA